MLTVYLVRMSIILGIVYLGYCYYGYHETTTITNNYKTSFWSQMIRMHNIKVHGCKKSTVITIEIRGLEGFIIAEFV